MVTGVTGGIGSGKSTVCDHIRLQGFPVIDADDISRQIVMPGSALLDELAEKFGDDLILADGTLDRRELGIRAFADETSKDLLDSIMMREIIREVQEEIAHYQDEGYEDIFVDAALLYEVGADEFMDEVWVVDAPEDERVRRVVERAGISEREVRERIASQMPQDEKKALADVVLDNSGSEEDLIRAVDELLKNYL